MHTSNPSSLQARPAPTILMHNPASGHAAFLTAELRNIAEDKNQTKTKTKQHKRQTIKTHRKCINGKLTSAATACRFPEQNY
jgi:hypothetical protein